VSIESQSVRFRELPALAVPSGTIACSPMVSTWGGIHGNPTHPGPIRSRGAISPCRSPSRSRRRLTRRLYIVAEQGSLYGVFNTLVETPLLLDPQPAACLGLRLDVVPGRPVPGLQRPAAPRTCGGSCSRTSGSATPKSSPSTAAPATSASTTATTFTSIAATSDPPSGIPLGRSPWRAAQRSPALRPSRSRPNSAPDIQEWKIPPHSSTM
jgi:hypothetical protein